MDVLRFGTERLWALELEAATPIVAWDTDEIAAARRYHALGPRTGLRALTRAAAEWTDAYRSCPAGAVTRHPEIGAMSRDVLAAANAHEVVHHARDIARLLAPEAPTRDRG